MEDVKREFLENIGEVNVLLEEADFISTVHGSTTDNMSLNSHYWWQNIRQPVCFDKAINCAIDQGVGVFIEIGPHPVLTTYMNECLHHKVAQGVCISTLKRDVENPLNLIQESVFRSILLSDRHSLGHYYQSKGNVVNLPVYPWDRQKYICTSTHESINKKLDHPLLGFKLNATAGIWTNQIDLGSHPYLSDHIVAGTVVFPAAAFIEMALAASHKYFEHSTHEINSFDIRSPLILEGGQTKELQFILNEDDLNFKIVSKDRLSGQAWHTHVVGRFISNTCEKHQVVDFKNIESNAEYCIEGEEVYRIASSIGLDYGVSFRGVESVYIKDQKLLSRLKITHDDVSQGEYVLNPMLLDAAFHTLFPIMANQPSKQIDPFLPIAFNDIRIYKNTNTIEYCLCEIITKSSKSITARFLLLDKSGDVIVQLEDCLFKQFALKKHENKAEFYGLTQIPKNHIDPLALTPLPSIENIAQGLTKTLNNSSLLLNEKRFNEEILPLYEALAVCIAGEALEQLGAYVDEFTIKGLILNSGLNIKYQPLISFLCRVLEQDDRASCKEGVWRLKQFLDSVDSRSIWRSIVADYPGYLSDMMITAECAFNMVDVLTGRNEIESFEQPLKLASNSHASHDITRDIIREAIEQIKANWPANKRRLRIAEFIDNTSCLSKEIVDQMPKAYCDYQYLAINEEIYVYANQLYKHSVNINVHSVEFSSGELCQNYKLGEFDIVIISNLLHKQADIQDKFSAIEWLLVSGGLLFIAESRPNSLFDMNMGINPEWWKRSSDTNQPVSSLMMPEDWQKMLMNTEFRENEIISDRICPESCNYVISAKRNIRSESSDENVDTSRDCWVIIGDLTTYASTVAETVKLELSTKGIQSYIFNTEALLVDADTQSDQSDKSESIFEHHQKLFAQLEKEQIFVKQVVYLNGIEFDQNSTDVKHTDTYSQCCTEVVALLKALDLYFAENKPKLWLVGTHSMELCSDFVPDQKIFSKPEQSVLWGFGRVIKNEYPDTDCHQLDVQFVKNVKKFADIIINEVINVDEETEIIMVDGNRYVNRIEKISLPSSEQMAYPSDIPQKEMNIVLSTDSINKLDALVWEHRPKGMLANDEIEISVKTAGLNFRDVMYASGMLSDEILQNGFAGPTLGLECAGVVSAIGSDESEFEIGDEVIAFAPSSFSSHIITKQTAVFPKPKDWSFEEAVTIPTTFFTVYYSLNHLARLCEGERLLVHGAAGGVGLAAIQYARYCGAEIFATAGTKGKRSFLRALGVEHVLNSRDLTFADEILKITEGEGVDVVLNSLAGEAVDKNLAILKPFGRFIELGKRDFLLNRRLGLRPFRNNITYFGVDVDQLMSHQQELCSKLLKEMMQLFDQGELRPLPHTVFPACDVISAFQFMQKSSQIGKVVISMQDGFGKIKHEEKIRFDFQINEQATYLITGGLSGFGFATAQWLVDKGAKYIVLLGRHGVRDAEIEDEIKILKMHGIYVIVEKCDVSDPISLKKVLRDIDDTMPPLKGVVHAAMVLDDHAIKNLSEEKFNRVFKPKIQGAWNLHELTCELPLDFFILYSSATTYIGNPGQANYVAANFYLEALARYRKKQDLPALAIAWDAIVDKGYLARNPSRREILEKRLGIHGITSNQAFDYMQRILASGRSDLAVINANWSVMKRLLPITTLPIYEEVVHDISDFDIRKEGLDITEMIHGLSREEVYVLVSELLIEEIANILDLPVDRIDHNCSIQELGVDSLMAMELLTAIESRFGLEMSVMALSDVSTVDSLTARLVRSLIDVNNTVETIETDDALVHTLVRMHAEDISEEELDYFIQEYRDNKG